MAIHFFREDTSYQLNHKKKLTEWLSLIIDNHRHELGDLNYIFCSDDYLLKINIQHLNHDYYTDIITFDHSEQPEIIEGDIFVSIDRVKENAKNLGVPFLPELYRVLVHGLLHLLGFNDKNERDRACMREKEDACISLLKA